MSEPTDYPGMSCDEFAAVAAELALGVLTGRERAAALAHLDGCESCRELVRELTTTGEELLALLPSREPHGRLRDPGARADRPVRCCRERAAQPWTAEPAPSREPPG